MVSRELMFNKGKESVSHYCQKGKYSSIINVGDVIENRGISFSAVRDGVGIQRVLSNSLRPTSTRITNSHPSLPFFRHTQ